MTKQNQAEFAALRMREPTAPSLGRQAAIASSAAVQARIAESFEETAAADNTFHVWRNQHLVPAHNRSIDFTNEVRVPTGKRAVRNTMQQQRGNWLHALLQLLADGNAADKIELQQRFTIPDEEIGPLWQQAPWHFPRRSSRRS